VPAALLRIRPKALIRRAGLDISSSLRGRTLDDLAFKLVASLRETGVGYTTLGEHVSAVRLCFTPGRMGVLAH
jgi:hypothetical protein